MRLIHRLGLTTRDGRPSDRAVFWGPLAGSLLASTGMALWLFS